MSLEIQGFTKRFGTKTAVNDLNLSLPQPGIHGLIGTNGAGKTTTIRMLMGVLQADAGQALWNGQPFAPNVPRFGYLPEERGIYAKTKVGEQLSYFARLKGYSSAEAKAAVKKGLARLEISEYENVTAEKLSKGNQQKVQLLAALLHDPELVVLDEPFSGLDPVNTEQFRGLLLELEQQGKTILLSSHQMATVEEYCRDITLLHKGETLLQGNLKTIQRGYGNTRLLVAAPEETLRLAASFGLEQLELRNEEAVFGIPFENGDVQCEAYLRAMLAANVLPQKFVLRPPSLHEIFIEKVTQCEAGEGDAA